MSLSYRKRGDIWHVRGSVRVGREVVQVREHSTGCSSRSDAEAVGAAEEARIRSEIIEGPSKASRRVTIGACILAYQGRPGGVARYDTKRLLDLNMRIGHYPLPDADQAWHDWLRIRGSKMAPATAARWRAILQAALTYGAKAYKQEEPRLSTVKQKADERVRFLTQREATRLLASYNEWVTPIALTLAYQGLRSQEALRLEWHDVNWSLGTLFIKPGKTGKARTVPMHPRVRDAIRAIWLQRKKPTEGEVFLSRWESPMPTRETGEAATR
jgi:integrase